MNSTSLRRTRTDRSEQSCPVDFVRPHIYSSTFVSECLAFNVKRKFETLSSTTKLICNSTKDSTEQLDALKELATLIVEDTRLGDHLDSQLLSHLIEFLEVQKNPDFQFYSAAVLENIVSSKKGKEFKDRSVPYLLNLISSPKGYVKTTALVTLTNLANVFPETCDTMIKNGALKHLESIITHELNHFKLLESGCQLLTAFCRLKPHLLSDKMDIVVNTLSTAIEYEHESVLIQVCLALSLLSDRRLVPIGTGGVDRLLDLIEDYPIHQILISALRTIGNYVRWGNDEEIQFMIEPSLLALLGELLRHKCTIVRKEACWILSNVTAVANSSLIQEVIDMGLIDKLLKRIRIDEFDVKEVAACAISNVFYGSESSDEKQFECIKVEYFPLLDDLRLYFDNNDPHIATLCSKILELDSTYLTEIPGEIVEPVSLPTKMEEGSSIGACMTSGTTASAKNAPKKIANKKKPSRRKKLSTPASPLDPVSDIRGDLGSEVIVSGVNHLSHDSATKHLDPKVFDGENKLKKGKKLSTTASLSVNSINSKGDMGSMMFKEGKKLSTAAAAPESSIVSTEELDWKKFRERHFTEATEPYLSCAGEKKSTEGKKLSTTTSISVNSIKSTGDLDSEEISTRGKHSSINSSESLGSKKLPAAASPKLSVDSSEDLHTKKITRKNILNKATKHLPSCAQKNTLKEDKNLSTAATSIDWSEVLELDNTYLTEIPSEIIEAVSLPTKMEEGSSIGVCMTRGTTANPASASAKNAPKKIANKKKSSRRKKLSTSASQVDPFK